MLDSRGGVWKTIFWWRTSSLPSFPWSPPAPLVTAWRGGPPPRRASVFPKIMFFPLIFHPFPRHHAGCGGVLVLGQAAEKPKSY